VIVKFVCGLCRYAAEEVHIRTWSCLKGANQGGNKTAIDGGGGEGKRRGQTSLEAKSIGRSQEETNTDRHTEGCFKMKVDEGFLIGAAGKKESPP